jgi:hypothetical protein
MQYAGVMTAEERFERIEAALHGIVEAQHIQADAISQLVRIIGSYADSADARMKRIEENLDGLIRAITAEHSNGKSGR